MAGNDVSGFPIMVLWKEELTRLSLLSRHD